jgi:hypothetical protein
VPLTYLSHQAPVVGLKILRPRWFDGTALVLGSMCPDLAYAFAGTALAFNAHTPVGLVFFCLPVTVLLCLVVRGPVAPVAFAQLPDTPLRLHDYRALSLRRPPLAQTAVSALIGAVSHALWDTFTHDGRWGARHVAFLREEVATIGGTSLSVARALQYVGHAGGAIVTLALLAYIADRRLLRQWYGAAFDDLAPVVLSRRSRQVFWAVVAVGFLAGSGWALLAGGGFATQVIKWSLGVAAGVTIASLLPAARPEAAPAPRRVTSWPP